MTDMEEKIKKAIDNEIEILKDSIILCESMIDIMKKKKKILDDYNTEIAGIMEKLKTDEIRQALAVKTQDNYKNQIEIEINIAEAEEEYKKMKLMLGNMENGRN